MPTLVVIMGPTAVGKTKLAIHLAQHFGTQIISADSRQFYKEMNIGTAKPTENELKLVKHHFVNNRSVEDYYSAGDFAKEAKIVVNSLFQSGHNISIAVGGSGLYLKAICEGIDEMPAADLSLRNELITLFQQNGLQALIDRLKSLNPEALTRIDNNNPQRLMRAIELATQGGIIKNDKPNLPYHVLKIGLERNRDDLYNRINQRVDVMMEDGLFNEVVSLAPYKELNALQTVGYKEIFEHLEGQHNLDRAVELIKQHSRNYAKKQITWFRKETDVKWFSPENEIDIVSYIQKNIM
ncbi:MAG: tRNA (adenosine(37)-N6)-dimethylallyltransferase MiaA [Bacteroidia bacterium]|nr:tRNA (adenosine(37)-N6)-dimethylallyltransferase MiaA [Bacteroidia bacterium]